MALTIIAFGQKKADTTKSKPVYKKYYQISPEVLDQLLNVTHRYRDVLIYNPNAESDDKIKDQAKIDSFMKWLGRSLKLDSAIVKK